MEPGVNGSSLVDEVGGDAEAADCASVGGKDARHETTEFICIPMATATGDQGAAIDVERGGGAPDVAPPGSQDLGADAVVDGEEGDDVAEDAVREVAEAVDADVSTHSG